MPLFYSAFGLSLAANRPIPGLVPQSAVWTDTRIRLDGIPPRLRAGEPQDVWYSSGVASDPAEPTLTVWKLAAGAYFRLRYSDGTEFVVDRPGSAVWARWPDSLTLEDAATYLLGPVLGFVLRLRGVTCLHASAVGVGGRAVALVGPASAGKSTTAAAFARMGHPVLTDDIVALWESADAFYVQPAYPQLRLWPDSVALLYGAADALPRLTPTWDKRALDLTRNGCRFQQQPLPLAAVYVLTERGGADAAPRVEGLRGRDSLLTLVANAYVGYLLDRTMRAQEFASLARVVRSVPVRRVTPPADPAHITQLCARILEDFQALAVLARPESARMCQPSPRKPGLGAAAPAAAQPSNEASRRSNSRCDSSA